jgi:hypothetical protein
MNPSESNAIIMQIISKLQKLIRQAEAETESSIETTLPGQPLSPRWRAKFLRHALGLIEECRR